MSTLSYDWEAQNRRTVLDGVAVLERTSDSLARSNQIALETEEVGTTVITELGEQRESLLRSKDRLTHTDDNLSKTKQVLRLMKRHVWTNRLILIFLIITEIGILAGVVYLKFFSKS